MAHLAGREKRPSEDADAIEARVTDRLRARGARPVTYAEVTKIEGEERARAEAAKVEELKFASDLEMLDVIGHSRSRRRAIRSRTMRAARALGGGPP